MHIERQILKQAWFNMDHSKTPVKKQVIVTMDKYPGRKGQGVVKILREGPDGYSSSSSHCVNPMEYLAERIKESKECQFRDDLSEYKLIIKE